MDQKWGVKERRFGDRTTVKDSVDNNGVEETQGTTLGVAG